MFTGVDFFKPLFIVSGIMIVILLILVLIVAFFIFIKRLIFGVNRDEFED